MDSWLELTPSMAFQIYAMIGRNFRRHDSCRYSFIMTTDKQMSAASGRGEQRTC